MKFACRKCRKILFDDSVFEEHTSTKKRIYTRASKKGNNQNECSSWFLERQDWMATSITDPDVQNGRLLCPTPNCGHKLGSYCHFGSQCSCGCWVCPAYQIPKTNVDEVRKTEALNLNIRGPVF